MKNALKTNVSFLMGLFLFSLVVSCDKASSTVEAGITDDDLLIESIQNATNKSAVTLDELPTISSEVLATDYTESYSEEILYANELGYQVAVRRQKGSQMGELNQVYFNTDGIELKSGNTEGFQKGQGKGKGQGVANAGEYGNKGKDKNECFDFVFPISFTLPDGSENTATSEDELRSIIKSFYESNVGVEEKPSINFPVDVVFVDGTIETIESEDDIEDVRLLCGEYAGNGYGKNNGKGKVQKGECFELVLPVTHIMPDGSEIIVADSSDRDAIKEWYTVNPDVEEKPTLLFPVEVVFEDGTTQSVSSTDEMMVLRYECQAENQCFQMVYPITHIMPDGTEIIVEDIADRAAIKAWYDVNPDNMERAELVFPVTVVYDDDSTVEVADVDALMALRQACFGDQGKGQGNQNGNKGNGKGAGKH